MWKPTNQPGPTKPVPPHPYPPATNADYDPAVSYGGTAAAASPQLNKPDEAPGASKRINVIFSAAQYQLLKSLAERQSISISDVLRQALSLTKLIVDANENPDERILIERKGQLQEIRLVR